MKYCWKCRADKPLDAFGKDAGRKDGKCPMCKECVRLKTKEYNEKFPERRKAVCAAYRERNPEKVQAAYQAWADKDPAHARAVRQAWAEKNREAVLSFKAKWRAENRAAIAGIKASRTAAEGHHTGDQIKALLAKQKFKCACCRADIRAGYHKDHIVSLKAGGTNDILNIQLLCQPCNLSKGAKHPVDFMQQRGFLL